MLRAVFFVTLAAGLSPLARAESQPAKPNILLIVADDLGWSDVGWHGGFSKTPHLDRLVREGIELDQHYVQPVCTPTRTALMSGRYPGRFGPHALAPSNLRAMPLGTVTLASALKSLGYHTYQSGKWHLGARSEWGPTAFGFDHGYGTLTGAADPWTHKYRAGNPYEDTNNVLTGALQPDPDSNRWDLGSDPIEFAKQRAQVVKEMMPGLVDRASKEGDDYYQPRRTFQILLHEYADGMFYVSRYVGGLKTSRSHRGDKDARPPITLIDVKLQRDALALLEENLFNDKPFQFPPELYNQLGFWNWMHWGNDIAMMARKDFGIHDFVLDSQTRVLGQLLSSTTLKRMHDAELRASSETDVLTTAELIQRLTKAVFSEVESTKEGDYTLRKPAISSLRRNLQRSYLKQLSNLALGQSSAPQDCQTVAYAELANLQQRIKALLDNQPVSSKLDAYSRAHLQESGARIAKVLEAKIELPSP
jgi:hypothetical protein